MFKMSTCKVKEPTHYSKRVGHEVPSCCVVAVLLSSKCSRLGGDVLKWLVVYEAVVARGHVVATKMARGVRKNSHKSKTNIAEC